MESELQIFSPSSIVSFFLFSFMVVCIFWRSKSENSNSNLPPGPPKVSILGNMHQIGAMPHQALAKWAKQYGPLMHLKLGGLSTIVVSSPEMAKEVMKTHDIIFANRPYVVAAYIIGVGNQGRTGPTGLALDGPGSKRAGPKGPGVRKIAIFQGPAREHVGQGQRAGPTSPFHNV